jgi:hypothetical protein
MTTEVKITKDAAETVRIDHPESNYGIFCFNSVGDLFLNSDYGAYCYAWRHYGTDRPFKDFLKQCNSEYVFGKFQSNHYYLNKKKLPKHVEKHVCNLIDELIKALKAE